MDLTNWNYYSYYLHQNPSEEQQIEKAKKEAIEAAEKSKGAAGGYFEQSKQALSTNYDDLVKKEEGHGKLVISQPRPINHDSIPSWMNLPKDLLDGSEGRDRLRRLAFNARYLSSSLRKMGFIVSGARDSPIVPLFIFNPAKLPMFSRLMQGRLSPTAASIVVVVVAYPATPLISGRARFCLSAAHTKNDIDEILRACDEVGDILGLKLSRREPKWSVEECIDRAIDLVHSEES